MAKLKTLADRILSHTGGSGVHATSIDRLTLIRSDWPTEEMPSVYEASLCLIAQGSKTVSLGAERFVYGAERYLLVSVDLPLVGRVIEATPDEPYLCCKIDIDLRALTELVVRDARPATKAAAPALALHPCDEGLTDAACRLVGLLDTPRLVPTLGPLFEKEILYRLLDGPQGAALRRIALGEGRLGRIGRAVRLIRERYCETIRLDELAAAAGMSTSSLHAHFKAVTKLTPIEFQKRLRLEQARAVMLSDGASAADAAFSVGYQSPSQFSREYARLFGRPPRHDVVSLAETVTDRG